MILITWSTSTRVNKKENHLCKSVCCCLSECMYMWLCNGGWGGGYCMASNTLIQTKVTGMTHGCLYLVLSLVYELCGNNLLQLSRVIAKQQVLGQYMVTFLTECCNETTEKRTWCSSEMGVCLWWQRDELCKRKKTEVSIYISNMTVSYSPFSFYETEIHFSSNNANQIMLLSVLSEQRCVLMCPFSRNLVVVGVKYHGLRV